MGTKTKRKQTTINNNNSDQIKDNNGKFYDPMAVTWSENYSETIEKFWNLVPKSVGKVLATLATFIVGISINGEWVNIFVHLAKQFGYYNHDSNEYLFKNFLHFLTGSLIVSYSMYLCIGGFLHWYYYVRQRDRSEEWKCQPNKWLTPEIHRHEIILGSITLFQNAFLSAVLACYISNGGYSSVYYKFNEYGWMWFFLQFAVIFIYQDYVTYWMHRWYHTPFLYKHFHKLHHTYKQPTAFSVTAIHPFESFTLQAVLVVPLFLFPVHWLAFYIVALYTYYHGIIDHSGINFKSFWWQPWQPDAIFHDNHHQYFHVNFGFNIGYWDKLHGTYRRKDRVYTEDIFYGKGKTFDEVSAEELKADLEERNSENPLAYRGNKLEYELSTKDVQSIKMPKKKSF